MSPNGKKVRYQVSGNETFAVENYNRAKPFSSFFPGVAGLWGIPLWAFYVNRGQCLASFGAKDKDHSILEFYPANQAYQKTALQGFRTFIKFVRGKNKNLLYEPFAPTRENDRYRRNERMSVTPYDLEITETNEDLGLRVTVRYIPVPAEPLGALARRVTVENIGSKTEAFEILDGIPKIVPYGMDNFCLKNISRTLESMMTVSNYHEKGVPFFHLKTEPQDRPEVVVIEKGNFYFSFYRDGGKSVAVAPIVDPVAVFGLGTEFLYPIEFDRQTPFRAGRQILEGRTPSALSHFSCCLERGQAYDMYAISGFADNVGKVNEYARRVLAEKDYVARKTEENKRIVTDLTDHTGALTSHQPLNGYIRQNYLDNILRGGYPLPLPTKDGPEMFYVYSRKHGDLERDYNSFVVLPTYFSQGNGNYRDINQNRRNDVFFNPNVGQSNIAIFMNMLQADGFNPHVLKRLTFQLRDKTLARKLRTCFENEKDFKAVIDFLGRPFDPGEFLIWIENKKVSCRKEKPELLNAVLSVCEKGLEIEHGEGFWSDHWHYNLDLFESFLAVYPERLKSLLLEEGVYTFYDNDHRVLPRDEKYVLWEDKIRQLGAVVEDPEKTKVIQSRDFEAYCMRLDNGKGPVYRTSLLVKLIAVWANKMCSLDPSGLGIEMESDKPNWNDSLNGLPGLFGSSTAETCELVRLIDFLTGSLHTIGCKKNFSVKLPEEIFRLIQDLKSALGQEPTDAADKRASLYWDLTSKSKEVYRENIRFGFRGKFSYLKYPELKILLDKSGGKLREGLRKATDSKTKVFQTYFRHEALDAKPIKAIDDSGSEQNVVNKKGLPCLAIRRFRGHALPLFLEGPVHLMRIMKDAEELRKLYRLIKDSPLYDKKLGMYRVSASMATEPPEIGRIHIFTPGWLENESVWLHMEYKYLLELIRGGLIKEFYEDIKTSLVPFLSPEVYGRSIFENSSFICSSAHPDPCLHGNGFVARLSGSTAEFIHIWIVMVLGVRPFSLDRKGKLIFRINPALESWLFTKTSETFKGINIPKDSLAFTMFADTVFVYQNPKRKPTFGSHPAKAQSIKMLTRDGKTMVWVGNTIPHPYAAMIRDGKVKMVTAIFE